MDAFTKLTGVVAPIDRVNIDTDQIIPAVFLKSIERKGFEDALFASWRYNEDGSENPDFILNKPGYRNANVLVAGLAYVGAPGVLSGLLKTRESLVHSHGSTFRPPNARKCCSLNVQSPRTLENTAL